MYFKQTHIKHLNHYRNYPGLLYLYLSKILLDKKVSFICITVLDIYRNVSMVTIFAVLGSNNLAFSKLYVKLIKSNHEL